ncbi:hypothetical protein G7Z17_g7044 [Cylindrodendrum hubeiense]|uniref:Uncharacterized protein n=1 Tax=Cylindrodendrum hubeiense TaxID=595255 RepID=A0A9P5LEL1_9HYPO|nr:hypothetical protein G7Z17_g7044 [Cylindrodendrum hubeiense]
MKGRPVDQIVYECMFPRAKSNDPQNFHALLQRSLIPEVRQETHAFYGHLETQEAKYPGLDYTHRTHRIRLARWPWHRRLFRAFDGLRLTDAEIAGLTKWEGTKWAKEKFEREQGISIRDTTADGFPDWTEIEDRPRGVASHPASVGYVGLDDLDDGDMDVESENEIDSVGVELNERLRAQAARREAGDSTAVLDEEWEQWLKNAIENGELFRHGNDSNITPTSLLPTNIVSAARAGQWSEVPDFLQPMLRHTLQEEGESRIRNSIPQQVQQMGETSSPSSPSTSTSSGLLRHLINQQQQQQQQQQQHRVRVPWPRRTYSDLRLPVGDSGPGQRTTEASTSGA